MSSLAPNEEVIKLLQDTPISQEAFQEKENAYIPSFSSILRPPIGKVARLMKEFIGKKAVRKIVHPESANFETEAEKLMFLEGAREFANPFNLLREAVLCTVSIRGIRELARLPEPLLEWFENTIGKTRVNPALISNLLEAQDHAQKRARVESLSVMARLIQIIWSVFGHRTEELRAMLLKSSRGDEDIILGHYSCLAEGELSDLAPVNVMLRPARCSEEIIQALLIYLAFGSQERFSYRTCPLLFQNARCTNYAAHMMLDLMTAPHGFASLCLLSPSYLSQFEALLEWATVSDQSTIEWAFPAIASFRQIKELKIYLPVGHQFYQAPSEKDVVFMLDSLQKILHRHKENWFPELESMCFYRPFSMIRQTERVFSKATYKEEGVAYKYAVRTYASNMTFTIFQLEKNHPPSFDLFSPRIENSLRPPPLPTPSSPSNTSNPSSPVASDTEEEEEKEQKEEKEEKEKQKEETIEEGEIKEEEEEDSKKEQKEEKEIEEEAKEEQKETKGKKRAKNNQATANKRQKRQK